MTEERDFEPAKYVLREVDEKLWDVYKDWLGIDLRQGWIYLNSAPGRGNTCCLERFQHEVLKTPVLGDDSCLIYADAGANAVFDGQPADLDPIANAVLERHRKVRQPIGRRLRNGLKKVRWLMVLFSAFGVTLLLAAMVVIHSMLTAWPPQPFSGKYWSALLDTVWQRPADIAIDVILAILAALIFEIGKSTWHYPKERIEKKNEQEMREKEIFRKYGEEFIDGLLDICRRRTTCIFLVDNSNELGVQERIFLEALADPSFDSSLGRRFTKTSRILVIFLETQLEDRAKPRAGDKSESRPDKRKLQIPKFSRDELMRIAELRGTVRGNREEFEQCLDMAEQHVKALFLEETVELRVKIEKEWEENKVYETSFDQSDLRVIYATLNEPTLTTDELLRSVNDFDLEAFYPNREKDYRQEVELFSKSQSVLFRSRGSYLDRKGRYFERDPIACKRLRRLLEDSEDGRNFLARAHYWWFTTLVRPFDLAGIPSRRTFSGEEQSKIRKAAWHVLQLGTLVSSGGRTSEAVPVPDRIESFLSTTLLPPERRLSRRKEAAAALLLASKFRLAEGRPQAALEEAVHALAWLPQEDASSREWFAFAARTLWSAYWTSFDDGIRAALKTLGDRHPSFLDDPNWRIYEQYEELLKGKFRQSDLSDAPPAGDSDLTNIWRLTCFLRAARTEHGFIRKALQDASIAVPEPLPAEEARWAECALLHLRALAAILRKDWAQLDEAIPEIGGRLDAGSPESLPLSERIAHHYLSARYHHLLFDGYKARLEEIPSPPAEAETQSEEYKRQIEEREIAISNLGGWLAERTLAAAAASDPTLEDTFVKASSEYLNASYLALGLGYRTFLLEAEFWHGELLWEHKREDESIRQANREDGWEHHFANCLGIETDAGWLLHSPAIHRIRYKFAEREDKSASIRDAFNMLESARKAGYPNSLVLRFHKETQDMIVNYGLNAEDRDICKIGAELEIAWARDLAKLPEALSERRYPNSLSLERAVSFRYAAQSERHARDLARAEELLDEALKYLNEPYPPAEAAPENSAPPNASDATFNKQARGIQISIQMERSWILGLKSDKEAEKEARGIMREVWKGLEPNEWVCTNVLNSIVGFEEQDGILKDPWTSFDDRGVPVDEGNPSLSLPAEYFQDPNPLVIRNRFHYRLLQMIWFGCHSIAPDPSFLNFRIAIAMSENRRNPSATNDSAIWYGQDQFGSAILKMTEAELNSSYLGEQRGILLPFLETVAYVFDAMKAAEPAINGFRMLTVLVPGSQKFLVAYSSAMSRHSEFVERAYRARLANGTGWFAAAQLLAQFLQPATNNRLVQIKAGTQITANRQSVDTYKSFLQQLGTLLGEARDLYAQGAYRLCLEKLEPLVKELTSKTWIQLPHLEALDLWLQCAARLAGVNSLSAAEFSYYEKRAALQREMTQDFIMQFRDVIDSPQMQQLAVRLAMTSESHSARTAAVVH